VTIFEELFHQLAAPVLRVGAREAPIPMAPVLEQAILPGWKDIVAAVRAALAPEAVAGAQTQPTRP